MLVFSILKTLTNPTPYNPRINFFESAYEHITDLTYRSRRRGQLAAGVGVRRGGEHVCGGVGGAKNS
jgi:hypothetical protein